MLPLVLQGSFNEILIIDHDSLRVIQANSAALGNLQYSSREFQSLTPFEILADNESAGSFIETIRSLDSAKKGSSVPHTSRFKRKDGSTYPVDMRIYVTSSAETSRYIVISNDMSGLVESRKNLRDTKTNYHTLISNLPGLTYQVKCDSHGHAMLEFVSDYAYTLLGIDAQALVSKPALFLDLIIPEDRASYRQALEKAGGCHLSFNWEGRIWITEWNDVKWIDMRVKRHELPDGSIIWDGIMLNTTQSKHAEAEIRESRQQISELVNHIEEAKEQERLRVAREVHDELGGNLTAVKIGLSWLQKNLPPEHKHLLDRASYLNTIVDQTMEATHRIASNLRPVIVELGIVSALRWQITQFCKNLELQCDFTTSHEQIPLDPDTSLTLFRIVQEALTNVAKHANATKLTVRIERRRHQLMLEIADNGSGIRQSTESGKKSFGLLGMKERTASLGGEFWVGPASEGGTVVRLSVPFKQLKG